MRGKLKATLQYWRSGVVGALVLLDCLVLIVCVVDGLRFYLQGSSFKDAVTATGELAFRYPGLIGLFALVFLTFCFVFPMATALLSMFWPAEHWHSKLAAKNRSIIGTHVFLSLLIALFTAIAVMMEVLSGWSNAFDESQRRVSEYSFISFWLIAVFFGKYLSLAYFAPILKKIFWRASVERGLHGSAIATEAAKEVFTEHEH